jgi:large subunit ribosomal protein L22
MATSADTLTRTNERPGTRAKLSNYGTSAFKVREVLNLIRGEDVVRAEEILRFSTRGPATPLAKLLASAVANAVNNDGMDGEELFVSACFADEGPTAKRWRPRARGRAGRIRKRSSNVTIIVSRLPEERLERLRQEQAKQAGSRRSRVAGSRAARTAASKKADAAATADEEATEAPVEETTVETPEAEAPEAATAEETTETEAGEAATEEAAAPSSDKDEKKEDK